MRTIAIAASFALALLPHVHASAGAETADQKAAKVNDDIQFAKDLARYRYFDLAVDWLTGIEKEATDPESTVELLIAKATVARMASDYATTREDRKRFFDEAIRMFQETLAAMPGGIDARKAQVLSDLASVFIAKGKFYTDELEYARSQEAPADARKALRATAEEAFKEAVKIVNTAAADLTEAAEDEELSEEDRQQLIDLALFAKFLKGEAYFIWAQLYDAQDFNREDYFKKAVESLEDFMWEAGEDNFFSVWAYYYQGMAQWYLGQLAPAEALQRDELSLSRLSFIFGDYGIRFDQLAALDPAEREFVQDVAEKAYLGAAKVYRAAAARYEGSDVPDTEDLTAAARAYLVSNEGNAQAPWKATPPVFKPALIAALRSAAIETVNKMDAKLAQYSLPVGQTGAYARLEKARALADRGETSEALRVAKEVVEKNTDTVVGYDGGILLAELSQGADPTEQPPAVLKLIAEGFLNDGRTLEAIATQHRVIAAATSAEDKKAFGPAAWLAIGRNYDSLGRFLEAALAYEEGMNYALAVNDEELLGDLASGAYSAWDRRYRETKDDFDQTQRNRVRKAVTDLNLSSDLQYFTAKEAFSNALALKDENERKAAFQTALGEFQKVANDSQFYERALVFIARTQAKGGNLDAALQTFDGLFARAKDPKFAVALDRKKDMQRGIALAEAAFYKADVLLDAKRFDDALSTLKGYEERYPQHQAFYPYVDLYRTRALVGLGRLDEAEALVTAMESKYPKDSNTTYAIGDLAEGWFRKYDEANKALPTGPDAKPEEAALAARDAALAKTVEWFTKHNTRTGFASFVNLRNVADWNHQLAQAAKTPEERVARLAAAEENFRRLFEKYGKVAAHQRALRDVKLNYARTLMAQRNFVEAEPLFRDMNAAASRDRGVLHDFARTLGGWLDEKDGQFEEIPGVGKHLEAEQVLVRLIQGIEAANDKGSPIWWQARVDVLFNMYMRSKSDPNVKESARKVFNNWETLNPDLGGEPYARMLKRLNIALTR